MTEEEILKLPYRPCVGVMILNSDGLIWSGRRIDNKSDAWQMPQGGIDDGEAPRAAALRELEEETSIPSTEVDVLGEMDRGQTQKWFAMRFKGSDTLINIETAHPEFSHWAWMKPSDLVNKIVPFKKRTYEQVFAAFQDHLET